MYLTHNATTNLKPHKTVFKNSFVFNVYRGDILKPSDIRANKTPQFGARNEIHVVFIAMLWRNYCKASAILWPPVAHLSSNVMKYYEFQVV